MEEIFKAKVQYGDLKGTASADRGDQKNADAWLEEKGLKKEDEFLIGIKLFAGENHGSHKDPVYVDFLLVDGGGYDKVKSMLDATEGPLAVRRVSAKMPIVEFFGLFKRFSIYLSDHGMLDGREFSYTE